MIQSTEDRKREATRAWAASISAQAKREEEAERRLNRAFQAAQKIMIGLSDDDYEMDDGHSRIFAALITAYKE